MRLSNPHSTRAGKKRKFQANPAQEQIKFIHKSPHMTQRIILASGSDIRAQLLRGAGVQFDVQKPRVDEEAIRAALQMDGAAPRDIADALAEAKALKISDKNHGALVLGCDQILALKDQIFAKPESPQQATQHLQALGGKVHHLYSAMVIYENGRPIWRHIGVARLTMRTLPDEVLAAYVARNWDSIQHSVGGYKIEEEGICLFTEIEGDTPTIQGLPLIPLLNYLYFKGVILS
jgi:septum formation protein